MRCEMSPCDSPRLYVIEQRLQHYTPIPKFQDLSRLCQTFAPQTEITRMEDELKKTNDY